MNEQTYNHLASVPGGMNLIGDDPVKVKEAVRNIGGRLEQIPAAELKAAAFVLGIQGRDNMSKARLREELRKESKA